MAQVLKDPFGKYRLHPKWALCEYATDVFNHIRECGSLELWWKKYEEFYQGVTIAGRDIHGGDGAPHFYKRIMVKEEDESSHIDDEVRSNEDSEMSGETGYGDDYMSYEVSSDEDDDDEMSYDDDDEDKNITNQGNSDH
jgi:hypothetical protein